MALRPLLILMCVYLGLTLSGLHAIAALLPDFIELWELSNTEAGWLNGSQYLGYIASVPLLAFTERVDAKRMMLVGVVLNALGYLGFALLADGLWSGVGFRVVQGVGFALTYMPGVKAITDRVAVDQRGRAASIYVSSFATVTSFSIIVAGVIADAYGWRAAFLLPAATNVAAGLLILLFLPAKAPEEGEGPRRALFDFGQELKDPRMRGFVIAATMHSIELLAIRGWTVVLLGMAFASVAWMDQDAIRLLAAFLILIGVPSSMVGGEFGHRRGFAYASALAMAASALACGAVGLSIEGPLWLFCGLILIHNIFVLADSGSLNGGAAAAALPGRRGAAITLMAFANAVGSLAGPILFGVMLDVGGREAPWAWALAFLTTAACVIVGVAALHGGLKRTPKLGRRR